MSKRSDSPVSDRLNGSSLDLSEGSSGSDVDSDNSRDVNLNSKKFTDCNLFRAEPENKSADEDHDICFTSEIEKLKSKWGGTGDHEEPEKGNEKLNLINDSELENWNHLQETTKNSVPPTVSSTPKPESAESQALCNLFTLSADSSPAEPENEGQTYLVAKTAVNQNTELTNAEISKKFQDLSFAFKTDSMTTQKRLQVMKRRRDQAELNIESELKILNGKLRTFQYLGLNSECVNLVTDVIKQLDTVRNASVQLSSSAEGYGYVQYEERLLDLIAVMLQHVETLESSKSESSKSPDKLKAESQRTPVFLDGAGDDDRIIRRRSLTATALEGNCRRRASIATLPRIASPTENGSNGKGFQWTPNRPSACTAAKKLSFSQSSPRTHLNGLPGSDDARRDSIGARLWKETRNSEGGMTNIDESPETRSPSIVPEIVEEAAIPEIEVNDSSLHIKQLFGSMEEESRRSSIAQEPITPVHCLRKVIEWNRLILSSTRFRWPENVFHYVPFYITWYVVTVLALIFIGGLFTGINACYAYSCVKYSAFWFAVPAFSCFVRRFYRFLLPLFLILIFAVVLFFLWLTRILLPQLRHEEVDSFFRTVGFEVRYLDGPPPA